MKRVGQVFKDLLSVFEAGCWFQEKRRRCRCNRFTLKIGNIFFAKKHLLPLRRGTGRGRSRGYRGQRCRRVG